jgi:hypothetical protein
LYSYVTPNGAETVIVAVGTEQVGRTVTLAVGAAGCVGCVLITTFPEEDEVHPTALVTV